MIYNTRNQNDDTIESQKKKRPVLMLFFSTEVKNQRTKYDENNIFLLRLQQKLLADSEKQPPEVFCKKRCS